MTDKGTVTDAEAAQAWADHYGMDLDVLRQLPFGQVALVLHVIADNRRPGATMAIPQHVVRTLATMERRNPPVTTRTSQETHT